MMCMDIDVDINFCRTNSPCRNGATCLWTGPSQQNYSCNCAAGYTGKNCEQSKLYRRLQSLILFQLQQEFSLISFYWYITDYTLYL